jgi:hypothetical protein
MVWRALTAGLVAALFAASPALADTYSVTGPDDTPTPPACQPVTTDAWTCPTLRSAVNAANADAEADFIGIGPIAVLLNAGDLGITENVTIAGAGAEVTSVGGVTLEDRVFTISNTSVADISGLTVRGGFSPGLGGNILVEIGSELSVRLARVTGGNAISGGGIAVRGRLTVDTSLIDGNTAQASGGAIANRAEDNTVNTTITNSTPSKNTATAAGGLFSAGLATTTLIHTTIGRNTGEGVFLQNPQSATATGVIIAGNLAGSTPVSCGGNPFSSASGSITDGTTCRAVGPRQRGRSIRDALLNGRRKRDITGARTIAVISEFAAVHEICQSIDLTSGISDPFVWKWTADGEYTAASAYRVFLFGTMELAGAREVWKAPAPLPPKIRFFFSLVLRGRLWTAERRMRHGL